MIMILYKRVYIHVCKVPHDVWCVVCVYMYKWYNNIIMHVRLCTCVHACKSEFFVGECTYITMLDYVVCTHVCISIVYISLFVS